METIDKSLLKKLANQLMFDVSDEEIVELQKEFEKLSEQMELLNKIDTEGVEEMVYPFEEPTTFLREDEVDVVISKEDALVNAKRVKDDYVLVPKVVK